MASRLHIIEICKRGESTFKRPRLTNFCLLIFSVGLVYIGFFVSKDYIGEIVSALAIFTGFYFTLIVYVTDKTVNKINDISGVSNSRSAEGSNKEESELLKRFKSQYKSFSEKIISQISYSIVISLSLIFITFLTQLKIGYLPKDFLKCVNEYYQYLISFIFAFTTMKLVHLILIIISNMQNFFLEELEKSHEDLV